MSFMVNIVEYTIAAQAGDRGPKGLGLWPDGILGRVALPSNNSYNWLASNGAGGYDSLTVGSLYDLLTPGPPGGKASFEIGGLPPGPYRHGRFIYAAGGPVIQIPFATTLLQVVHAEQPRSDYGKSGFWSQLGLARSYDNGYTWTWLGVIIQPYVNPSQNPDGPIEITGGPIIVVGPYLFCYYRETVPDPNDPTRQLGYPSVARALAADVFQAAALGTVSQGPVSPWRKWAGYDALGHPVFTRQARNDSNGAAGFGEPLVGLPYGTLPNGNFFNFDWFDVVVVYTTGKAQQVGYLMAFVTIGPPSQVYVATSVDRLNWSLPLRSDARGNPVPITNETVGGISVQARAGTDATGNPVPVPVTNAYHYYPSLVFPTGNMRFGPGTDVHLYYLVTPKAVQQGWDQVNVIHVRLVVSGP